jgi:hypothetical protein
MSEVSIRALATSTRAADRIEALVALHEGPATELHIELLERLLTDKSKRVRALAADKIVIHDLGQLTSAVEAAAERETDAAVAEELLADLDYLRRGFHVRKYGEFVAATCSNRGRSITKLFKPQEFKEVGEAWISEQLERLRNA